MGSLPVNGGCRSGRARYGFGTCGLCNAAGRRAVRPRELTVSFWNARWPSKHAGVGIAALTLGLGVVMTSTFPAAAINSYNATPAPERTEVGALIARWDDDSDPATPDRVDWVCSGTMVDADTFLTAGHCTTDWPAGVRFYVSLAQDVQSALNSAAAAHPGDSSAVAAAVGVEGTAHTDPAYPGPSSDPHDIAVIQVPSAAVAARWTFTPATLPTAGAPTSGARRRARTRRHDHHRRHPLLRDQRDLPAGLAGRTGVPRAVRHPSLTAVDGPGSNRSDSPAEARGRVSCRRRGQARRPLRQRAQ